MDVNVGGRTRKAIAEVGKTGWAYILDRADRQAAHRHRRAAGAAGAAAGDRRDAAVPARRRHRAAADRDRAGRTRAGQRRPHLHAVRRQGPDDRGARHLGRRQLAAERLRSRCSSGCSSAPRRWSTATPAAASRSSCRRRHGSRLPWRRHDVHARRAHRHHRGARRDHQQARVALSMARAVLQRHARDRRRAAVRRPQRRAAHRARLGHRASSSGSSRPAPACTRRRARSSTTASSTCWRTRPATRCSAPRAATASGCSVSTGRCRRSSRARRCRDKRRCRRRRPAPRRLPAAAASAARRVASANVAAGQRLYEQACVVLPRRRTARAVIGGAPLAGVKDLAAAMQTVTAGPQQHAAVQRRVHARADSRRERLCGRGAGGPRRPLECFVIIHRAPFRSL